MVRLENSMMIFIITLIIVFLLIEIPTAIFVYQIFLKVENQKDEPIESIAKLNIYPTVINTDNYIIVKGFIFNKDNSIEVKFLVDSGANRSLLKKEILEKLGTLTSKTTMTYGSGTSNDVDVYQTNLLLNKKSYEMHFAELSPELAKYEHLFMGIIGSDFLSITCSYIDYKNNVLICPDI